jgi:leucine dehydrogenase
VIVLRDELAPRRRKDVLRDFADTVAALDGAYVTAEDVGTSAKDMETIAEQTPHVRGLARSRGGSGDPSPFTALGVVTAIEVACERVFGSASLKGRSVAVVGLGHVGARIARLLARAGADLLVADIDEGKRALADQLGARWVTPDKALAAGVDVYAPCALGGVLDHETVPELQCPIVAGAANNQLADDGIADLLNARDILWAPDFVANAGGIINIAVEFEPGGYDDKRAKARVRGIGDTLDRVFDDARSMGATPAHGSDGARAAQSRDRRGPHPRPGRTGRRQPHLTPRWSFNLRSAPDQRRSVIRAGTRPRSSRGRSRRQRPRPRPRRRRGDPRRERT